MDVTMEVSRIPVNDETQLAEKMLVFPGGKGGNQAVGQRENWAGRFI